MSGKDKRYKEKQSGKTMKRTQWASAAQRPVVALVQQGCLTRDLREGACKCLKEELFSGRENRKCKSPEAGIGLVCPGDMQAALGQRMNE